MLIVIAALPPLMFPPATLLLFAQFVAPVFGLAAVVAVVLDRLVQIPLRPLDPSISVSPIVCLGGGRSGKQQEPAKRRCCQRGFT